MEAPGFRRRSLTLRVLETGARLIDRKALGILLGYRGSEVFQKHFLGIPFLTQQRSKHLCVVTTSVDLIQIYSFRFVMEKNRQDDETFVFSFGRGASNEGCIEI